MYKRHLKQRKEGERRTRLKPRKYCETKSLKLGFGSVSRTFLLVLVSTVILGYGSRGTHDHIFLSYDAGSGAVTSEAHCNLNSI
jgi:hypothetical protein